MDFPGQICLLFSPGEGKEDVLKAVEGGRERIPVWGYSICTLYIAHLRHVRRVMKESILIFNKSARTGYYLIISSFC